MATSVPAAPPCRSQRRLAACIPCPPGYRASRAAGSSPSARHCKPPHADCCPCGQCLASAARARAHPAPAWLPAGRARLRLRAERLQYVPHLRASGPVKTLPASSAGANPAQKAHQLLPANLLGGGEQHHLYLRRRRVRRVAEDGVQLRHRCGSAREPPLAAAAWPGAGARTERRLSHAISRAAR